MLRAVLASLPSPSATACTSGPCSSTPTGSPTWWRCHRGGRDHRAALGARRGASRELVYEVALWGVPRRADRRAAVLPGHQLERGAAPLVGAVRRSGRAGSGIWGGNRRWDARGPAGAPPPRRRHRDVHGRGGARAARGPGDRPGRQLLQPGALRRANDPPWGLEIDPAHRPAGYAQYATFHPTFLYELIWNLTLAGALVWLGRRRRIRAAGAVRALRRRLLGSAASSRSSCASTRRTTSSGCA